MGDAEGSEICVASAGTRPRLGFALLLSLAAQAGAVVAEGIVAPTRHLVGVRIRQSCRLRATCYLTIPRLFADAHTGAAPSRSRDPRSPRAIAGSARLGGEGAGRFARSPSLPTAVAVNVSGAAPAVDCDPVHNPRRAAGIGRISGQADIQTDDG